MAGYGFTQKINSNRVCLVYKIGEQDQIDNIEHKMITSNVINGLLNVTFCGINDIRYYNYDISSKITLSTYLNSPIDHKKILIIFKHLCESLINTDLYLISNKNIILDKDYIYIDLTSFNLYMVCLPVDFNGNFDLKYFIKDLIFNIKTCDEAGTTAIRKILEYVDSIDILILHNFYDFTKSLYAEEMDLETTQCDNDVSSCPAISQNNKIGKIISPSVSSKENKNRDSRDSRGGREKSNNDFLIPDVDSKEKIVSKKANQKHKKLSEKDVKDIKTNNKKRTVKVYGSAKKNFFMNLKSNVSSTIDKFMKMSKKIQPPQIAIETEDEVEKLVFSENTVFISSDNVVSNASPYIIRMSNDEKAYITKDIFKIGKDMNYADFVIKDNPTISRAHAEIVKVNGNYYIQDNNSKNHTYVDEDIVVGTNKIKLLHNSRFRLSNEDFMFKLN